MEETGTKSSFIPLRISENFPYRVFCFYIALEILLVIFDYVVNVGDLVGVGAARRFANLAREDGIGTWFASSQLIFVSITAFFISYSSDRNAWSKRGWFLISLFFLFMSADEASQIHERLGTISAKYFESLDEYMSYTWQIVLGPFFVLAGIGMCFFFYKEFSTWRKRLLIIAALGCLAFAVGLDVLEGKDGAYDYIAGIFSFDAKAFDHAMRVTEETLEMFGITIFLFTFLRELLTSRPLIPAAIDIQKT
jgi:hypothetical protein